jgi:hypothetical protein
METSIKDFEKEIQQLDPLFTITPNANCRIGDGNTFGLNNIFYDGRNYDLPVVADVVKSETDPNYRYTFRNGYAARCWSKTEILERLVAFLGSLRSGALDDIYSEKE